MEGDCLSCIKYLMFIFNFFIFLCGASLLGVGIWVIVDPTGFREIVAVNPLLFMGAYIVVGMGALLFLLGFLGCCGAIRENKCLLLFFFVFMITFACCGVNGPQDFEDALHFKMLYPDDMVPEACCRREAPSRDREFLSKEDCLMGREIYQNTEGCYTAILDSLETYVYLAGALAIGVLAIELFAMASAMCLFRGIQ